MKNEQLYFDSLGDCPNGPTIRELASKCRHVTLMGSRAFIPMLMGILESEQPAKGCVVMDIDYDRLVATRALLENFEPIEGSPVVEFVHGNLIESTTDLLVVEDVPITYDTLDEVTTYLFPPGASDLGQDWKLQDGVYHRVGGGPKIRKIAAMANARVSLSVKAG